MDSFTAFIFDMDGLLLDSEKPALETFIETCTTLGLEDHTHLFLQLVGTNSELGKSLLEKGLRGKTDPKLFDALWNKNYKNFIDSNPTPLKEGVEELLKHIESFNLPLAVATSTNTELAGNRLEALGILNYFTSVVGGDKVTKSKPAPDIYLKAASTLTANPKECLAFEDSSHGVRAAVVAGMTVIQIPDLVVPDDDLLSLGHIVLESLLDVPNYNFR